MINTNEWKKYIPDIDGLLQRIGKETIIGVGIVPYSRVTTALFVKNSLVYSVKYAKEIDLMRKFTRVVCLEERDPKLAQKVNSTGYLLRNHQFQGFLKSLKRPYRLAFYNITHFIHETLQKQHLPFIGNVPETVKDVLFKADFRATLKKLNLPVLPDKVVPRAEFLQAHFEDYTKEFGGPYVCQRGDYDAGGEIATYFITNEQDLKKTQEALKGDERFSTVQLSPYVTGDALSMVGCVTKYGVLTGPLQTQLIDIPESLGNVDGRGVFVGHDWNLKNWGERGEEEAVHILTTLGEHLSTQGYKGIFGVDLIYDTKRKQVFPLECNPRYTGSFPMVSLLALQNNLPPFDLFHLAEHLGLSYDVRFAELREALRFKSTFSHILLTVKGVRQMPVELPVGIYHLNEKNEVRFVRPGLLPSDIRGNDEFLLIDPVLKKGAQIGENVFKLFKLVFPVSIAESSYKLRPEYARIVQAFYDFIHA